MYQFDSCNKTCENRFQSSAIDDDQDRRRILNAPVDLDFFVGDIAGALGDLEGDAVVGVFVAAIDSATVFGVFADDGAAVVVVGPAMMGDAVGVADAVMVGATVGERETGAKEGTGVTGAFVGKGLVGSSEGDIVGAKLGVEVPLNLESTMEISRLYLPIV